MRKLEREPREPRGHDEGERERERRTGGVEGEGECKIEREK